MIRLLAIASLAIGLLSLLGEWLALDLPSVSWFFEMGPVFGWVSSLLLISGGIAAFLFLPAKVNWTPVTLQRFRRFRSIRRGWWSLLLLAALVFLALALLWSHGSAVVTRPFRSRGGSVSRFVSSARGAADGGFWGRAPRISRCESGVKFSVKREPEASCGGRDLT